MTKAKAKTTDYTAQVKEGFADLQERAKTAYDKGQEFATEMGEFTKGNVEAVVESGKILAAGRNPSRNWCVFYSHSRAPFRHS